MSTAEAKRMAAPQRSPAITTASILYLVAGLGTLASEIPAIGFMIQNRTFPVVFGIPLMGSSFSEKAGIDFTIRAASVFLIVSALEALAGYRLWKSDKRGGILGLILLPVGLPFWILFELPVPLIIGPLRAIAVVAGWKILR
jgi:hypothetical protein